MHMQTVVDGVVSLGSAGEGGGGGGSFVPGLGVVGELAEPRASPSQGIRI